MKKKKLSLFFLFISFTLVLLFFARKNTFLIETRIETDVNKVIEKNVDDSEFYLNKTDSNNILFVETNISRTLLTFKELCAIESAAKHNPELNVILFSVNARIQYKNIFTKTYPNIKYQKLNLDQFFNNTFLNEWWSSNVLAQQSYFREAHLADALRLQLLYEYGGVYSDLDTIVIKNLSPLRKYSGVGTLNNQVIEIGNGFMHFYKNHDFILYVLKQFASIYNPSRWDGAGPKLINSSLYSFCNLKSLSSLLLSVDELKPFKSVVKSKNTCNLFLYPSEAVYPYHWIESAFLFKPNEQLNITKFLNTYSIHFYGFVTGKYGVRKNQINIYQHFASSNCPVAYNLAF